MELEQIADRIAAVKGPGEEEEQPARVPDAETINWGKLRNIYEAKMKNTVKDLGTAIKKEDAKDTQLKFESLVKELAFMAKATRQRDILIKIKNVIKELDEED
jgi:sulfite reductase beta subunit-like hemoprotein